MSAENFTGSMEAVASHAVLAAEGMLFSGDSMEEVGSAQMAVATALRQHALERAKRDGRSLVTSEDIRAVAAEALADAAREIAGPVTGA
jgi:hypothetical protein